MKKELMLQGGKLVMSGVGGETTAHSGTVSTKEDPNRGTNRRTKGSTSRPTDRPKGAESAPSEIVAPARVPIPGLTDGVLAPLFPLPGSLTETFTHLTERQFDWLAWRMGTDSDAEADELAGVLSVVSEGWREDPLFESAYQRALENKREAFRVLGTHLLPKALRVINKLLSSDSVKANTTGLQFLLKTQALLDQPQKDQSEQVTRLLEALRVPGHVTPVDIRPRE